MNNYPYGSRHTFWKEVGLGYDDWGVSRTFEKEVFGSFGSIWGMVYGNLYL